MHVSKNQKTVNRIKYVQSYYKASIYFKEEIKFKQISRSIYLCLCQPIQFLKGQKDIPTLGFPGKGQIDKHRQDSGFAWPVLNIPDKGHISRDDYRNKEKTEFNINNVGNRSKKCNNLFMFLILWFLLTSTEISNNWFILFLNVIKECLHEKTNLHWCIPEDYFLLQTCRYTEIRDI